MTYEEMKPLLDHVWNEMAPRARRLTALINATEKWTAKGQRIPGLKGMASAKVNNALDGYRARSGTVRQKLWERYTKERRADA